MISTVTRKALEDKIGVRWHGNVDVIEFLERLYDLDKLLSEDQRFRTFREDIVQHTINNDDWSATWIFNDKRAGFDDINTLLRFICESIHPEVLWNPDAAMNRAEELNAILKHDGYELYVESYISNRPVWRFRRIALGSRPNLKIPASVIAAVADLISRWYSQSEIDNLFERQDLPRPVHFGSNKLERAKDWLRQANLPIVADPWIVLGDCIRDSMEGDSPTFLTGEQVEKLRGAIQSSLQKIGLAYSLGGQISKLSTSLASNASDLNPIDGSVLDENSLLGRGGFGSVFLYTDPRLSMQFAVKVYDPHPFQSDLEKGKARFYREAAILFKLRNPHIIQIYQIGELTNRRPYIKMEYFPGANLLKYLQRAGRPAPEDRWIILGRITNALAHAHQKNIIHRDLKPSNVIIGNTDNEIRVIDFGMGILIEDVIEKSRLTNTNDGLGSSSYMDPELIQNPKLLDPKTDIYSLGAIWYELATGRQLPRIGAEALLGKASIEQNEREWILRCLEPTLSSRPQTGDVLGYLRKLIKRPSEANLT